MTLNDFCTESATMDDKLPVYVIVDCRLDYGTVCTQIHRLTAPVE